MTIAIFTDRYIDRLMNVLKILISNHDIIKSITIIRSIGKNVAFFESEIHIVRNLFVKFIR